MKHEEAQQTTSPRSYHPSGRYGADLILGTSCGGGTTLDVAKGRERHARGLVRCGRKLETPSFHLATAEGHRVLRDFTQRLIIKQQGDPR
jgi:hypothetical protein